jgi:hypothetical protein
VADSYNETIRKITLAGVVTTLAGSAGVSGSADGTGSAARFSSPGGVATDSGGNIYVTDAAATIRKITPSGVVTTLAGSASGRGSEVGTGSAASFNRPAGVAADSGGNVYVADTDNSTIRKITPAGVVTTVAGSAGLRGSADGTGSAARFNSPWGVATDSSGNVYVADSRNDTIRKITPAGVVTTLAGSAGFFGSEDGTGSAARFNSPWGVATDSSGNVYVADSGNHTIRKMTPAGVVTTLAGLPGLKGRERLCRGHDSQQYPHRQAGARRRRHDRFFYWKRRRDSSAQHINSDRHDLAMDSDSSAGRLDRTALLHIDPQSSLHPRRGRPLHLPAHRLQWGENEYHDHKFDGNAGQ